MHRHHELVDRELVALIERRVPERILVIEEPPRHGKSEHVSNWLPAWYQSNYTDRAVGLASYSETFAKGFGRKARASFKEACRYTGLSLDVRRDAATEWGVKGHPSGGMYSAGVGGAFTGRGFGLLVCDDLIKNAREALSESQRKEIWEWWQSTAFTRLDPDGVAVVMATRWHPDDLIGRLVKASVSGEGLPVRRVRLPALAEHDDTLGREEGEPLWPEQWSIDRLMEIKESTDIYWWNALYQQRPSQHADAAWPDHYFGDHIWYRFGPDPSNVACRVLALDPSLGRTPKSDYSALVMLTVTHDGICWVDADLQRRDITQIIADSQAICTQFQPDVWGVEENGFRSLEELIHATWKGVLPPVATVLQSTNKLVRIKVNVGPLLANKRLRFAKGSRGAELLVQQLKDFPLADHDDGPDGLEIALRIARSLQNGEGQEDQNPILKVVA